jgi:UPF0288 family protein (methanogenesis marker protein 3)
MTVRNKPFEGEINIGRLSSLRKLMRAARREKIPDERMGVIQRAMQSAEKRAHKYRKQTSRGM